MSISRREILKLAGATGALSMAPTFVRASGLEKKAVHIAVGGESLVYRSARKAPFFRTGI